MCHHLTISAPFVREPIVVSFDLGVTKVVLGTKSVVVDQAELCSFYGLVPYQITRARSPLRGFRLAAPTRMQDVEVSFGAAVTRSGDVRLSIRGRLRAGMHFHPLFPATVETAVPESGPLPRGNCLRILVAALLPDVTFFDGVAMSARRLYVLRPDDPYISALREFGQLEAVKSLAARTWATVGRIYAAEAISGRRKRR